uniref:DUF4939 domain-containing protein n=1 Tax=Terrapene triunguis TaxID=2587831 RepID=A0A674HXA7_9SAUR
RDFQLWLLLLVLASQDLEQTRQLSTENTTLRSQPAPSCPKLGPFWGFMNQNHFLFLMFPQIYVSDWAKGALVTRLLTGDVLDWASPLLEGHSPVLSNWDAFLQLRSTIFDDPHQEEPGHTILACRV